MNTASSSVSLGMRYMYVYNAGYFYIWLHVVFKRILVSTGIQAIVLTH